MSTPTPIEAVHQALHERAAQVLAQPVAQAVAFVALASPEAALSLLSLAQALSGDALTAFELMSDTCIALVEKHLPGARLPLAERAPWYVLVELSDHHSSARATEAMETLLEAALEQGLAEDAVLASSLSQFDAIWALRESISEAQAAEGKTIKHDISLPISAIHDFVLSMAAAVAAQFPAVRLVVFGHLGDGNLHYNVSPSADQPGAQGSAAFVALEPHINRLVHDAVVAHGGSISAEHGLGVLRRDEAARYRSGLETQLMGAIKTALDPFKLMNPGKLLP